MEPGGLKHPEWIAVVSATALTCKCGVPRGVIAGLKPLLVIGSYGLSALLTVGNRTQS
jgi:hypothetical protein